MMLRPVRSSRSLARRQGAAMLLLLLLLVPILGMVAFAIDAGMMVLLRAEVQNAVDSGALAAALTLQSDPDAIAKAEKAAREFIQRNRAGVLAMARWFHWRRGLRCVDSAHRCASDPGRIRGREVGRKNETTGGGTEPCAIAEKSARGMDEPVFDHTSWPLAARTGGSRRVQRLLDPR